MTQKIYFENQTLRSNMNESFTMTLNDHSFNFGPVRKNTMSSRYSAREIPINTKNSTYSRQLSSHDRSVKEKASPFPKLSKIKRPPILKKSPSTRFPPKTKDLKVLEKRETAHSKPNKIITPLNSFAQINLENAEVISLPNRKMSDDLQAPTEKRTQTKAFDIGSGLEYSQDNDTVNIDFAKPDSIDEASGKEHIMKASAPLFAMNQKNKAKKLVPKKDDIFTENKKKSEMLMRDYEVKNLNRSLFENFNPKSQKTEKSVPTQKSVKILKSKNNQEPQNSESESSSVYSGTGKFIEEDLDFVLGKLSHNLIEYRAESLTKMKNWSQLGKIVKIIESENSDSKSSKSVPRSRFHKNFSVLPKNKIFKKISKNFLNQICKKQSFWEKNKSFGNQFKLFVEKKTAEMMATEVKLKRFGESTCFKLFMTSDVN